MNRQLAFDRAVNGILNQGGFARNHHGSCRYRTESGHKCAAGHLIPDDRYQPHFEGMRASTVPPVAFADDLEITGGIGDQHFLNQMQKSIHDDPSSQGIFNHETFLRAVGNFAEYEGLAVNLDQQETTNVE